MYDCKIEKLKFVSQDCLCNGQLLMKQHTHVETCTKKIQNNNFFF